MATRRFLEETWWARFLTIQAWHLVLLFIFVVAQELVKGVGRDNLRRMFFGTALGGSAYS